MNQVYLHILSGAKNLHIAIPFVLSIGCELGVVWIPSHAEQFRATQKVLIFYGLAVAANTSPAPVAPTPSVPLAPKP